VICGQLENCKQVFQNGRHSGRFNEKLQPLDIAVNKPFKDQLRSKWENWMMGGIHEYNKTGQMKRPSYKDIVAWIVESWAAANENCVRND